MKNKENVKKSSKSDIMIGIGIALIILQFMSYKGIKNTYNTYDISEITSFNKISEPYGIFYTLGANIFIICGLIILIIGIIKGRKDKNKNSENKNTKVINKTENETKEIFEKNEEKIIKNDKEEETSESDIMSFLNK